MVVSSQEKLIKTLQSVQELPTQTVETYARLWQLETWLRQLVYVELQAFYGKDWKTRIQTYGASTAQRNDEYLRHMPTPEKSLISYAQFNDLCKTIHSEWPLFETYLLPEDIWDARLEEIKQIRHRVAHFRLGHHHDFQRVIQLLCDLDQGFWRFCTSYNPKGNLIFPSNDPVVEHLAQINNSPNIEIYGCEHFGNQQTDTIFSVMIHTIMRDWVQLMDKPNHPIAGCPGYLYDVNITISSQCYRFNYRKFLENTISIHSQCVHLILVSLANNIRVTIPAVLDTDKVVCIISQLFDNLSYSLESSSHAGEENYLMLDKIQHLANEWPEYVIGPKNPLSFLCPDMPCSFFNLSSM